MTKELLLKSAKTLPKVSTESKEEYSQKRIQMVEQMNTIMLNRSDSKELVGEGNLEMMKDNHSNHARFMVSVFENYVPEIFLDTILWVFRAYRSRNFKSTYWAAQLNTWISIFKKELSENCQEEILPYYEWMQINIPLFNQLAEDELDAPLSSH